MFNCYNRKRYFLMPFFIVALPAMLLAEPVDLQHFASQGYTILTQVDGDLNGDMLPDRVVLMELPKSDDAERVTLLLIGQPDHHFKLVAHNSHVVYCRRCGGALGDPFDSISINNGTFTITHYGGSSWRWSNSIRFRYEPSSKRWLLQQLSTDSFSINRPDDVTTDIKTAADFGNVAFSGFTWKRIGK